MSKKKLGPTVWLTPLVIEKDFSVQFRDDHVHVELGSDYSIPERQDAFWEKIRALCETHHSQRVLVEGFVPRGEQQTDEVVDSGLRSAAVPRLWIAFHLNGFVPSEGSELFEAVAASQGVRVKFFSTAERALSWLRHNPSQ